jgi:hypothetical protein
VPLFFSPIKTFVKFSALFFGGYQVVKKFAQNVKKIKIKIKIKLIGGIFCPNIPI